MTRLVDRTQLQALMASGTVTIVDALPEPHYHQQRLPGALNLVEADLDTRAGLHRRSQVRRRHPGRATASNRISPQQRSGVPSSRVR
jgi:rhodanese-related sulfurtransferase